MVNVQKQIQTKLTKGLLDLITLQLLDSQPMYGYQIITTIRKAYGVCLGASTMYPTLNNLEKNRLVKSEWNTQGDHPKKIYELTSEGQNMLQYSVGTLTQICKKLDNVQHINKHIEMGMIIK